MLKKIAVVVAIATAGLTAVSPLAFATGSHPSHVKNTATESSSGLVNVADNNVNTPLQACNNDVPINGGAAATQVPIKDLTGAATGALGLFGTAAAKTDQATDNSRACGDNTASGDSVAQEG
ncbi:MAG TPA: hypothetical protein VHS35_08030 [Pseudonocardia sp.]|nr:hypothetical protein [Pseudonocardia sp.]